jgi:hypothetical protein
MKEVGKNNIVQNQAQTSEQDNCNMDILDRCLDEAVASKQDVGSPDQKPRDIYEFCIEGYLSPLRSEWFDGLTIANLENGNTLLNGQVVDQSALHGLLSKIRDMNLRLISVKRL